jgi:hypothetical protein
MGREAEALCHWAGTSGQAHILLESAEIILRGELRARIPRASIRSFRAQDGDLTVEAAAGRLVAELGGTLAESWAAALAKPPPSLAAKLGVGPRNPAFITGDLSDAALADALSGATVAVASDARQIVAVLLSRADLDAALSLAAAHPDLPVWCVYPKGAKADPGDAAVRADFRAAGWMDTKTSAVSDRLTATRYNRAKAPKAR